MKKILKRLLRNWWLILIIFVGVDLFFTGYMRISLGLGYLPIDDYYVRSYVRKGLLYIMFSLLILIWCFFTIGVKLGEKQK